MAARAKLLLVEDDPAIRRLVRAALDRAGYEPIEAANAREALSLADTARPDLALLDLGLPDRDGLELIQLLRNRGLAVIVISARQETDEKVAALDLGADDYLTKPFDTEELLARVRTAMRHRHGTDAGQSELTMGDVTIALDRRRVTRSGTELHLPGKEYGVLAALARRPDRVVTHADLLRTVWGPAHLDRVDYLRIAIRGLRQKLEHDPAAPQLILTELGVGYRLADRGTCTPD
jgi:two-component system, OmpR family, KDP operon response regulator KdpE